MTTATTEKLFEKRVGFQSPHGGEFVFLRLVRSTDGETEVIAGEPAAGINFGVGWAEGSPDRWPSPEEVEAAVGDALGFAVRLKGQGLADGKVVLGFERDEAPEPAPAPGPSPDTIALSKIQAQRRKVVAAYARAADLKTKAKSAKELWQCERDELEDLIRISEEEETLPLLQQSRNGQAKPPEPVPDESWRKVPLTQLGLTEHVVGLLHEAEIDTLGDLTNYKGQERQPKIRGIGKAAWDKIDQGVEDYFRDHPIAAPAEATAPATEEEAAGEESEETTGSVWSSA